MRYFRLLDDVHIPGRWHLGEVSSPTGPLPNLLSGSPLPGENLLSVEVTRSGRPLELCLTSFGVPVATHRLANAIAAIVGAGMQPIPLVVEGGGSFVVLHCTRIVECLDESRSEFVKWTEQDHRADLVGQYRMVTRLLLDPARIPMGGHLFRVAGWPVALIVSEPVMTTMENIGCLGAVFRAVI